jgi:predicted dehydrogenase
MQTNAKPRIVLVGAGSMGAQHARVVAQSNRVELVRVVEPRREVGEQVADRFAVAWTPELGDLADADAVIVAAATGVHFELAREVLGAGKPLLVEKPICGEYAETEAVLALAEQKGLPIMCGFLERFNPAIMTIAPMVGEPVHVAAVRHSPYASRIHTGVAWDLLIHDVDTCLRLTGGQPAAVRGGLGFFHPESVDGAEDVAEAVMSFPSGAIATASASRIGQRKVRTLTVTEMDRTIEVDLLRRDVTIWRHVSNDVEMPDGRGYRQQTVMEIPELVSAREPLAGQLDHFLGLLDGTVDLKEERDSIRPAHWVVAQLFSPPATA